MRIVVAAILLLASLAAIIGIPVLVSMRRVSESRATGIGFVLGSPLENLVRLLVLLMLGILAYWFSGKLVRS